LIDRTGALWVAVAAAMWAADAYFRPALTQQLSASEIVFAESLLIALCFLPVVGRVRRELRRLPLRQWIAMGIIALGAQAFGQSLAVPGVTAAMSLGVSEDDQGVVAGLNSSTLGFGRMLGPLAGTGLYELRAEYPYMLSCLLLVVVMVALGANRDLRHTLLRDPA